MQRPHDVNTRAVSELSTNAKEWLYGTQTHTQPSIGIRVLTSSGVFVVASILFLF